MLSCYLDNGVEGAIELDVEMPINPDGSVTRPRIRKATRATPAVRACLLKSAKEIAIAKFEGPPGMLRCRIGGNVRKTAQMINVSVKFVPNAAAAGNANKPPAR